MLFLTLLFSQDPVFYFIIIADRRQGNAAGKIQAVTFHLLVPVDLAGISGS